MINPGLEISLFRKVPVFAVPVVRSGEEEDALLPLIVVLVALLFAGRLTDTPELFLRSLQEQCLLNDFNFFRDGEKRGNPLNNLFNSNGKLSNLILRKT